MVVKRHQTITLEVGDGRHGCVHGQLLVVYTKTVAMCIRVREETGLEDRVWGGLNIRDKVGWGEGGLFDLGEIVLDILIEDELADGAERELAVRPNLGEIKDVVTEFLGLVRGHCLL